MQLPLSSMPAWFQPLNETLDIAYENADRSIHGHVLFDQWNVDTVSPNACRLHGCRFLAPLNLRLHVWLDYTLRETVIEKKITCYQNGMVSLFIGLTQTFTHPQTQQLWSFDAVKNEQPVIYGGLGKQAFPAAGMLLQTGEVLGILMDTGIANEWSRWHLRRTANGNAPVVTAYDPMLMAETETRDGICLQGGLYAPTYDVPFDAVNKHDVSVLCRKSYAYNLECDVLQCPCQVSICEDGCRPETHVFQESGRQVLALPQRKRSGILTISWENADALHPIALFEQRPALRPWHQLRQNQEKTYRYFFFCDVQTPTLRNLRKLAQVRLAEALGFSGTTAEKILYADFSMLCWQAEPGLTLPLCVPSIDYFEMYFRDIFWSAGGVDDPQLNKTLLDMVESTMDENGWVDNIITPYFGSIEKVDNEINYLYVLWNYRNMKRFGFQPNLALITKVVRLVMERYDPERTGIIKANNPQSLMDVMWQDKPCEFAVSQGYYALMLRVALALGIDGVDQAYADKAQAAYRGYFRPGRSGRSFLQTFPENHLGKGGENLDIISCLDLEPEFLSLYLLNESLLGRKIVLETLEQMPIFSGCLMPIMAMTDASFFSRERNPFNGGLYWEDGRYANGGSYLRPQYIVLAVGKYHGWAPADGLLAARLRAEFETCQDAPVSVEYLHALGDPAKSSDHKVFAWNVFVNEINRWIRQTMDPTFQPGDDIA